MTAGARRVLIVEDEMLVGILIEDMLGEMGYTVAGMATRVGTALPMVATLDFDLAILDVNLGEEMSFPIADAIAEKGLPYLFATGYGRQGITPRHAGQPVVAKPFSSGDLKLAIEAALAKA
jgi:DNA-binding response OmpR family regulator